MSVRVRYAPSPTGRQHIGNFRTGLYNYLFARKHGGVFFLRIEDTDQSRLVEKGIEITLGMLARMGLTYDEGPFLKEDGTIEQRGSKGPYIQSERLEIYRRHVDQLAEQGAAYPCFCATERLEELRNRQEAAKQPTGYDRLCRAIPSSEAARRIAAGERHVYRARMTGEGETVFEDAARGRVSFRNDLIDDYVLLKSDGFPTYHLASVVDDHLMETTHVIRGEEWLSSTPKHLLLYAAFGWEPPKFAHMPLLLNPDRSKLSKRQGDVAVEDYLDNGYLPEALINFVALLGWNPSDEKEIYSLEELVREFNVQDVNPAGAVFNREKLDWLNGKYLRALPLERLAERAGPFFERANLLKREGDAWIVSGSGERISSEELGRLLALERERVKTLAELPEAAGFLLASVPEYPKERLCWKGQTAEAARTKLETIMEYLNGLDEAEFEVLRLEQGIKTLIENGRWTNGETLWPFRVALSGREKSPGPFEIAAALGKMKTIRRLESALDRLK